MACVDFIVVDRLLVGCLESSVIRIDATAAKAALTLFIKDWLDVDPALPAFSRLALSTVAVKSLLPNFPHSPQDKNTL